MKKFLLSLLCLCSSFALNLSAQQSKPFEQDLYLGVKGGILSSRFSFNPSVAQESFYGWGSGAFLRWEVERYASIQLELNYLHSGWLEETDAHDRNGYMRSIGSLNLPFLTHLHIPMGRFTFFVNAGPIIGYRLTESIRAERVTANAEGEGQVTLSPFAEYRHNSPMSNRFFWGLGGGPGLSLRISKHHSIELEGRYTYSLGDFFSNKRSDYYGQSAEQRTEISINYLYQF